VRDELLAAALRLFSNGGLQAVSMRAAAAAVGVSAMTPYRYFAQKADRLSGVWEFVRELAFAYGCAAPLLRNAPPRAQ